MQYIYNNIWNSDSNYDQHLYRLFNTNNTKMEIIIRNGIYAVQYNTCSTTGFSPNDYNKINTKNN